MNIVDGSLRSLLLSIASSYDPSASFDSRGQQLLKIGESMLNRLAPAGLLTKSGGGKGRKTMTPWMGILDPDETSRPQSGLYVVYIYSSTLRYVHLALVQGTDQGHHTTSLSREHLRSNANSIREALISGDRSYFSDELALESNNSRQRRYAAGAVVAKKYRTANLPPDSILVKDFYSMLRVYRDAVSVKRNLLLSASGLIKSEGTLQRTEGEDVFRDFRPKDNTDYFQHVEGRRLIKSRRHEALIAEFGTFAELRGLSPATNVHPRDLTLLCGQQEWLVEAKVVGKQPAHAVRQAVGQLFEYEFLLYEKKRRPVKTALFSEPIGEAFIELLSSLTIGAIWKEEGSWKAWGPADELFAS